MAWGNNGGNNPGPWGRPGGSSGGSNNNGGGNQPPNQPPDFDAMFRKGQDHFRKMFSQPPGQGSNNNGRIFALVGLGLVLLWLASGVYFVKPDEQGVVLRFGEYHRTTSPGIGYHFPYPFETVVVPKVTAINRMEIGFRSGYSGTGEKPVPVESLMLTGDENIVDINFEVQWKIDAAEKFLFNIRNPEESVKAVSESAMREVIGKTNIATVLAEGKLEVELATSKLIQETLDTYGAGIEVVNVNLLKVDPPAQVIDAFRDVQTARADLETARNQAEAYRNDVLPRARGAAQKMILDAEAYKQRVIEDARGEASRFAAVYSQYRVAKDMTRKRMYLETMETIMPGMNKVILDSKSGNGAVPYLPLSQLKPASSESNASSNNNSSTEANQ